MRRSYESLGWRARALGFAAVAAIFGCDRTESPGLYAFEMLGVEQCARPEGADAKKRIVGVRVRVTGRAESGIPANYFYASLITHTGQRYLAEPLGCRPLLSGPPLAPGERAEGFLNFAVPLEQNPERVLYLPNIGDRPEREVARELLLGGSDASPSAAVDESEDDELGEITEDE